MHRREKKARRYQAVIDPLPAGETVNVQYGLSFSRHITKEDIKKYD